jgi:hypothetical protein
MSKMTDTGSFYLGRAGIWEQLHICLQRFLDLYDSQAHIFIGGYRVTESQRKAIPPVLSCAEKLNKICIDNWSKIKLALTHTQQREWLQQPDQLSNRSFWSSSTSTRIGKSGSLIEIKKALQGLRVVRNRVEILAAVCQREADCAVEGIVDTADCSAKNVARLLWHSYPSEFGLQSLAEDFLQAIGMALQGQRQ